MVRNGRTGCGKFIIGAEAWLVTFVLFPPHRWTHAGTERWSNVELDGIITRLSWEQYVMWWSCAILASGELQFGSDCVAGSRNLTVWSEIRNSHS